MSTVSIGDDIIDSRDVEARIDELRGELSDTPFADPDYDCENLKRILEETPEEWQTCVDNFDHDTVEELIALVDFKEGAESATSEWSYGATFIHESYFRDYAQQLADDIGAVDSNAGWPNTCIDWDQAANELKADYAAIEVAGNTYYTRA